MASLPAFHSFKSKSDAWMHRAGGLDTFQVDKAVNIQGSAEHIQSPACGKSEAQNEESAGDRDANASHESAQVVLKEVKSRSSNESGQSPVLLSSPKLHGNNESSDLSAGFAIIHPQKPQDFMTFEDETNSSLDPPSVVAHQTSTSTQPAQAFQACQNNDDLVVTSMPTTQAALQSYQFGANLIPDASTVARACNSRLNSTKVEPAQAAEIIQLDRNQAAAAIASRMVSSQSLHDTRDLVHTFEQILPDNQVQAVQPGLRLGCSETPQIAENIHIQKSSCFFGTKFIKYRVPILMTLAVPVASVVLSEHLHLTLSNTLSIALFSTAGALVLLVLFVIVSATRLIMRNMHTKVNTRINYSELSGAFYIYVLGSGGHTTEMMSLIKISHKPNKNTHRRYLITTGDKYSYGQRQLLEDWIGARHVDGTAGTSDLSSVPRARSVHEPLGSTILSVLRSGRQIAAALHNVPDSRANVVGIDRYPDVIVTNGPGTGFIVALVVFIMKVLFLVPRNRLKVVFVETWARGHELSVTGMLFYKLKLANLFVVQSEELARIFNVPCVGNVNQIWADSPRSEERNDAEVHTSEGDPSNDGTPLEC